MVVKIEDELSGFQSMISHEGIFAEFINEFRRSYEDLLNLMEKLCDFIPRGSSTKIEEKFRELIATIGRQLHFLLDLINEQIVSRISRIVSHPNLFQSIESFLQLFFNLTLFLICLITILPTLFLLIHLVKFLSFQIQRR